MVSQNTAVYAQVRKKLRENTKWDFKYSQMWLEALRDRRIPNTEVIQAYEDHIKELQVEALLKGEDTQ